MEEQDVYQVENKNPEYEYAWAADNPRHPQSVMRLRSRGYEPVKEGDKETAPFAIVEDGVYKMGDSVLVRIRKDVADMHRRRRMELINSRLSNAEEQMGALGTNIEGVTAESIQPQSTKSSFFISNNPLAKTETKRKAKGEE